MTRRARALPLLLGLDRAALISLVVLLLLAAAVRASFAAVTPVFLEGDSQSYLLPAWELAHGQGFSPELRRTPVYPVFLAGALKLFGESLSALALAQHLVGLGTVAAVFLLARQLFGLLAGLIAGLALALSGPQLIYERYVMTEVLFGFVLVLSVLVQVAALRSRRPGLFLLAGVSIGLAALTRPVAQAVLPLFLLASVLLLPRWRPALSAAGLALLGAGLLLAPWAARNFIAHESVSASGGLGRSLIARTVKYDSLFDWKWLSETYADREDTAGRARMLLYRKRGNIPASRSVRPYQDALVEELGLSQGQAESTMRDVALEAIARRPLDYLRGSLAFTGQLLVGREESLQSHWKQRANKDWAEQWDDRLDRLVGPVAPAQSRPRILDLDLTDLYQPGQPGWPLLVLIVLGIWAGVRTASSRAALLVASVAVLLLALSAFLDGPVLRYRHPIEPLLCVLAAGGLVYLGRAALAAGRHWRSRPASSGEDRRMAVTP